MKGKKVFFLAFFVFMSLSIVAQTTLTPQVKSSATVQEKVNPGGKQDPSTRAGSTVVGVITSPAINITTTSAESGYTLTNAIGTVTRHGICLNRKPNPTTSGATFTGINKSGSVFTVQLSGLAPSTTFYIRAYATAGTTTIYGNELSFTTPSGK